MTLGTLAVTERELARVLNLARYARRLPPTEVGTARKGPGIRAKRLAPVTHPPEQRRARRGATPAWASRPRHYRQITTRDRTPEPAGYASADQSSGWGDVLVDAERVVRIVVTLDPR